MEERSPLEANTPASPRLTRRRLLKSAAALAAATLVPSSLTRLATAIQAPGPTKPDFSKSNPFLKNPRWYGFNLLEYFSTDADWMKYFPYKNDGMFLEDDFRWIRDWGFNWVRLPMDYRFWTSSDLFTITEKKVEPIDRAIRLGEKFGVHVNLCLHRAPGLCILDTMDEKLTGIHVTKEKTDVFTDLHTFDAFVHQWTYFADRYKGISSKHLSFNLVNEPIVLPNAAELAEMRRHGPVTAADLFSPERMRRHEKDYVRLAKASHEAIHQHDPQRLVISDGYAGGGWAVPELAGTGMLQSCHTYTPMQLTHHKCEWARGMLSGSEAAPTWPLKDEKGKVVCDRQTLTNLFTPWGTLSAKGVPIHFGEMGCYKHTPPEVVLAWFRDTLDVIGALNSGWALWNFRGPFGVLDTERPGTKFEEWRGHKLDRPLLTLLQQKIET
ncbi:MAG TPA: cellulase family glycosylhydrolase [Terriglobales bacterium]|nr:cellulase family glycosylhydrolase [Terriglobales bacterium]